MSTGNVKSTAYEGHAIDVYRRELNSGRYEFYLKIDGDQVFSSGGDQITATYLDNEYDKEPPWIPELVEFGKKLIDDRDSYN